MWQQLAMWKSNGSLVMNHWLLLFLPMTTKFDCRMAMNDDRWVVWNICLTSNDDKCDDDDDENGFVYRWALMNRKVSCWLIHWELLRVRLMNDELLNRFVRIDRRESNEELNILDLNRYHIYHHVDTNHSNNEVHRNLDRLSKEIRNKLQYLSLNWFILPKYLLKIFAYFPILCQRNHS